MSDHLQSYTCFLEGEITLDSTTPVSSGGFSDLYTATHPTAGKLALKKPRDDHDGRLVAHIEIEAGVWASLKHPRILQFLGIHKIDNNVYLVSAFAENGCLPGFLQRRPDVDRRRLVIELAEGLAYLHQCGIIHGDLKGNNLLICGGEHVLLCDFGLAKHVTSRTLTSFRGVGSIPWLSPELLEDASRRTFQSDVYAFGITVFEVLSGKEPYAHHVGVALLITGVLGGERPPKEPQVAPDGSSYLQLWDEASKCWAEDPSLRRRIIDVLKRLDHQRAETLVTSQQRVLEDSLILPIEGAPTSQLSSALDPSSLDLTGSSTRDRSYWAHRIRARMSTFVNTQEALGRVSPGIIIMIIENHLGQSALETWRDRHFDSVPREESSIYRAVRCAELRAVCRAWRDAIDNTPELTQCILLDGRKTNIEYVRRCNRDSPLEFLVNQADCPTRSELCSILGSLVRRVCSLTILSTDLSIRSTPFPMLRSIRICRSRVPNTFAADLLGMIHANENLTELILDSIEGGDPGTEGPPRLRIDHTGLQRVQLTQLSPHLQLHILHSLRLRSSVILRVDKIRPEYLNTSNSTFGDLIRSLGRMGVSASHLELIHDHLMLDPDQVPMLVDGCIVRFDYVVPDHALLQGGQSPGSIAASKWSQLESAVLSIPHAADMIRTLQDSGIELESAALVGWNPGAPVHLLHCLSAVTRLILDPEAGNTMHQLGNPLPKDPGSADEYLQFLCPNLEVLEVVKTPYLITSELRQFIQRRQTGTHPTNGLAKLRKIGLPSKFIKKNRFTDPIFEGIEIYSV